MLNGKHVKDQYQPAKSDLYSDSMTTTILASPVETPARGKIHIGDKVIYECKVNTYKLKKDEDARGRRMDCIRISWIHSS